MKPFARIFVSSLAFATGIFAYGATPVAVSLGMTFPEPTDVYGLHLSPIAIEDGWVFQIGLVNGIGRDSKSGWFDGMRYLPVVNFGW